MLVSGSVIIDDWFSIPTHQYQTAKHEFAGGAEFQPSKGNLFNWDVIPVEVLMLGHTRTYRRQKSMF